MKQINRFSVFDCYCFLADYAYKICIKVFTDICQ